MGDTAIRKLEQRAKNVRNPLDVEKPKPPAVIHQRISEIETKPIRWLWRGRIARGKVSMIAGHPGLGKSQITSSFAAIVTIGGQWPVDRTPCERGSVLFLSAEDDPADTIRPRLEAAGADLQRVHILHAVRDGFSADGEERHRGFNLKEDVKKLETALAEIGEVALVVIDPVSAYLGQSDSHNNAEVRALLAPLSEMAARAGVAVVAVSHLNKGGAGGGDALMRVTGSLAFVAAARAAYAVVKDKENEARRFFLPLKNNNFADVGGLAFCIEAVSLAGGIDTSRISWESEAVSGMNADELLRPQTDPEDRTEIEEAADWLKVALMDGAVEARELFQLGDKQGFNKRALQRARTRIGAQSKRDGFGKGSRVLWSLIDDKKPIDDPAKRVSPMPESVAYGGKVNPEGEAL